MLVLNFKDILTIIEILLEVSFLLHLMFYFGLGGLFDFESDRGHSVKELRAERLYYNIS